MQKKVAGYGIFWLPSKNSMILDRNDMFQPGSQKSIVWIKTRKQLGKYILNRNRRRGRYSETQQAQADTGQKQKRVAEYGIFWTELDQVSRKAYFRQKCTNVAEYDILLTKVDQVSKKETLVAELNMAYFSQKKSKQSLCWKEMEKMAEYRIMPYCRQKQTRQTEKHSLHKIRKKLLNKVYCEQKIYSLDENGKRH